MFLWFAKKPSEGSAPGRVSLNESPGADKASVDSAPTPSSSTLAGIAQDKLQLRTPSPSIHSSGQGVPASVSPTPATASTDAHAPDDASTRVPPPPHPAEGADAPATLEATPESLLALVKSVPAKTLYAHVLSHLPRADDTTFKCLAAFFGTLQPPPQLHCVRCHKDYVEVENTDRSCLVPHDDESAEVERVRRLSEVRRTAEGTMYETLWGCCGKITEGDGSQGPPDGWCYEGGHTTDIKRARFRADSTPNDDKLVSCLRLNCHNIRDNLPRASARLRQKRVRQEDDDEDEDDESEGASDSGIEEITGVKSSSARKGKGKGKGKGRATGDAVDIASNKDKADEDVTMESASVSRTSSARKARSRTTEATPTRGGRPRGRPRKQLVGEQGALVPVIAVQDTPAKRARGRPRKQPVSVPAAEGSSMDGVEPRGVAPSNITAPVLIPSPMHIEGNKLVHSHNPNPAPVPTSPPNAQHTPNPKPTSKARPSTRKKYKSREFIEDSDAEIAADLPAAGEETATASGSAKRPRRASVSDAAAIEDADGATKKRKV